MLVAPFHSPQNVHARPPTWNIGSGLRLTLSWPKDQRGDVSAAAARLRCVVRTPFGVPVVPDVYICRTGSALSPRPPGSTGCCAASQSSYCAPTNTTCARAAIASATSPATSAYRGPAMISGA